MDRTGIHTSAALLLFENLQSLPAINVTGLHVYDGNIRDTDLVPRTHNTDLSYGKVMVVAGAIELMLKRNNSSVNFGSNTVIAHIGVNTIREIKSRGAKGELHDVALWRKYINIASE